MDKTSIAAKIGLDDETARGIIGDMMSDPALDGRPLEDLELVLSQSDQMSSPADLPGLRSGSPFDSSLQLPDSARPASPTFYRTTIDPGAAGSISIWSS